MLTIRTCDDAREAVAAASDTEGVRICIARDVPLGAALDISAILYNGRVQNDIIDPGVLENKVRQANWLIQEINNAQEHLERLQLLLHRPWLP
jgi:hypothetical protein